jgi:transposase
MADELVTQRGLPVELAHPGYVARLKRSPDKTDFTDAHLLADLARVNYLPRVWLAPESIRQLRRLVRHRAQLVRRRRDVKLRIRALLRENRLRCDGAAAWRKDWMTWLQDEAALSASDRWVMDDHLLELASLTARILQIETKLAATVEHDPIVAKLLKQPGVGLITAVTMRAEIGRFDRFDNGKQLARFCGVTPRNASSGNRQADAGMVKAGNPELRTVLVELAHRLIHRIKRTLGRLGLRHAQTGQTQECGRSGRRQPLGAMAVPRTSTGDMTSGSGSTKGGRPFRPHHRIDLG